jgi:hypothetical protein
MICKHDHLEFRDQGNRIICKNEKCSRTWFRETAPGSWMPFMGLTSLEEMIPSTETRSNPYATITQSFVNIKDKDKEEESYD